MVNHKRTERIYSEEGLSLRIRKRKKLASCGRVKLPLASQPNEQWAKDFMHDALSNGRRIRILTIIDTYTRECPRIEVDTSIGGGRVSEVLSRIASVRGLPEKIIVDHGPEFASNAMDAWAYERGVKLHFIRPGKLVDNAYIESFNGKFRDECLNQHWFMSLEHARRIIEEWGIDYNEERPHSSQGHLAPNQFMRLLEYSNSEWHH